MSSAPTVEYMQLLESGVPGISVGFSVEPLVYDLQCLPNYGESKGDVLTTEEVEYLKQQTFQDIVGTILNYLPEDYVTRYYPGLTRRNCKEYDISRSMVFIKCLSHSNYEFFQSTYKPERGADINLSNSALLYGLDYDFETPDYLGKRKNLSNRLVIILDTESIDLRSHLISTCQKEITSSPKYKDEIIQSFRARLRHELLHTFGVGTIFDDQMREEALLEYINSVLNSKSKTNALYSLAYPFGVLAMQKLYLYLQNEAFYTDSALLRALVGKNPKVLQQLHKDLSRLVGERNCNLILRGNFETSSDFYNYVYQVIP